MLMKCCLSFVMLLNFNLLQKCRFQLSVQNEAEALPNLMKPNQNAQSTSIFMWQKGLDGGLLISVLFSCIITAFYRVVEGKIDKISFFTTL